MKLHSKVEDLQELLEEWQTSKGKLELKLEELKEYCARKDKQRMKYLKNIQEHMSFELYCGKLF